MSAQGTESYMAPEVLMAYLNGEPYVDNNNPYKVDVYSLGVVFFKLLAKEMPFNKMDIIQRKADPAAVVKDKVKRCQFHNILISMLQIESVKRPEMKEVIQHIKSLQR